MKTGDPSPPSTATFSPDQVARARWYRSRSGAASAMASFIGFLLLVTAAMLCSQEWLVFHLNRGSWLPRLALLITAVTLILAVPMLAARLYIYLGPARAVGLAGGSARQWWRSTVQGLAASFVGQLAVGISVFLVVRDAPWCWVLLWAVLAALTGLRIGVVSPLMAGLRSRRREVPAPVQERAAAFAQALGVRLPRMLLLTTPTMRAKNAFVTGLGPSRRFFVTQTLLASPPDQVDVVLIHELAHLRHRDVEALALLQALLQIVPVGFVAWFVSHHSTPVRIGPASYPLLLIYLLAGMVISTLPLVPLRRRQEQRADRLALAVTRDPAAFKALITDLSISNLDDLADARRYGRLNRAHRAPLARMAMADDWSRTDGSVAAPGSGSEQTAGVDERRTEAPDAGGTVRPPTSPPIGWALTTSPPIRRPGRHPNAVARLVAVGAMAIAVVLLPQIRRTGLLETEPVCYPAVTDIDTAGSSSAVSLPYLRGVDTSRIAALRLTSVASTSTVVERQFSVIQTTGCPLGVELTGSHPTVVFLYSRPSLSPAARERLVALFLDS